MPWYDKTKMYLTTFCDGSREANITYVERSGQFRKVHQKVERLVEILKRLVLDPALNN